MKRHAIIVSLLLIQVLVDIPSYAQTEKGNFLFGGQYSIVFSNKKASEYDSFITKQTSLEISPQVGYFIFRNFTCGLEFRYSFFKKTTVSEEIKVTSTVYIPFIRSYFGRGDFRPYLHLGIGTGNKTTQRDIGYYLMRNYSKVIIYEVRGGIGISMSDNILFDVGIGYNSKIEKLKSITGIIYEHEASNNGVLGTVGVTFCF